MIMMSKRLKSVKLVHMPCLVSYKNKLRLSDERKIILSRLT